jgi:hypothetical protein
VSVGLILGLATLVVGIIALVQERTISAVGVILAGITLVIIAAT